MTGITDSEIEDKMEEMEDQEFQERTKVIQNNTKMITQLFINNDISIHDAYLTIVYYLSTLAIAKGFDEEDMRNLFNFINVLTKELKRQIHSQMSE